jgi:hypothetical protein
MTIPPLQKKQPPQTLQEEDLKPIHLDPTLSINEITNLIFDQITNNREKDLSFKLESAVAMFQTDVFKHLEAQPLKDCIHTFIERILLISEKERNNPNKRKFIPMKDNSPKISEIA